jgi:hypothetical protein
MNLENLYYIPLTIPKLPFKNAREIIEIFYQQSAPIDKKTNDMPTFWDGFLCYKSSSYKDENLLYPGKFVNLENLLTEEIEILSSYLPLDIETISLWSNRIDVPPHVDQKVYDQEFDFRFRFTLIQEDQSFYIYKKDKFKFIKMPEDTNTFTFNNINCKHGGTKIQSRKILGIIRGKITDMSRMVKLFEDSYLQYKDFALTNKDF